MRDSVRKDHSRQRIDLAERKEKNFWWKDEKSWGFNKRYQWVKIEKYHARKVTKKFEKWFRESHAESWWRLNKSWCLRYWRKKYNGWTQMEGCRNRETDRH